MIISLNRPVAVICHDAGSANIIYSWLESAVCKNPELANDLRIYSLGPAKNLLNKYDMCHIKLSCSLKDALYDAKTLIAGTGWETALELQALILAQRMGIKTISVIDHWINYSERFSIKGWSATPEEIWVTDFYAKSIARKIFPSIRIEIKPNLYISKSVDRINSLTKPSQKGLRILYVLEPIRTTWAKGHDLGEFDALEYFFLHVERLFSEDIDEIRLRPHPSESQEKYRHLVTQHRSFKITLDDMIDLECSIAWSDVVVGCQTMAMVVALEAGRKVISSMPPWAPPCALPHKDIEKMAVKFLK